LLAAAAGLDHFSNTYTVQEHTPAATQGPDDDPKAVSRKRRTLNKDASGLHLWVCYDFFFFVKLERWNQFGGRGNKG
jgi:hypothetical protein